MQKWRTPSSELKEAIEEKKNSGRTLCKSMEEFDKTIAEWNIILNIPQNSKSILES